MLIYNAEVFNEVITGTATWYSYAPFNETLGTADMSGVFAYTTNVSGSPTLSLYTDISNDGRLWFQPGSPIVSFAPSNGLVQTFYLNQGNNFSFMRLRINLGGASQQCQLKLNVVGRSFSGLFL